MEITFLNLFVLASALWRLSSLVANESGPAEMFKRFRAWADRYENFHEGLCCEWCNSLWFSPVLVLVWYYFGEIVIVAVLPLALSAWVIVMKYVVHTLQGADRRLNGVGEEAADPAEEKVVIEPAQPVIYWRWEERGIRR